MKQKRHFAMEGLFLVGGPLQHRLFRGAGYHRAPIAYFAWPVILPQPVGCLLLKAKPVVLETTRGDLARSEFIRQPWFNLGCPPMNRSETGSLIQFDNLK
jgi:hypothetical protein